MPPKTEHEPAVPLIEILENVLPEDLHQAAWGAVNQARWFFGHSSNPEGTNRFWKMNLDGDPVFDAIWKHVQPRCQALAGAPLRVIRQYANGHTHGLGGEAHTDDHRPGTFTFLYYANLEWKPTWDGETVYFGSGGELEFAVQPRPNRAVFFDARISHAGRAPSRSCHALRVTVAYKLEIDRTAMPLGTSPAPGSLAKTSSQGLVSEFLFSTEAGSFSAAVAAETARLAASLRLPAFRPGQIPGSLIEERYAKQLRDVAMARLGAEATAKLPPGAHVLSMGMAVDPSQLDLHEPGAMQFKIRALCLGEMPEIDFSGVQLERLKAEDAVVVELGLAPSIVAAAIESHLKSQILDRVHEGCQFEIPLGLVEAEFAAIWQQVSASVAADEKAEAETHFRSIAERRVRLGLVASEMGRRRGIASAAGADLEASLIADLLAKATVVERSATSDELREFVSQ